MPRKANTHGEVAPIMMRRRALGLALQSGALEGGRVDSAFIGEFANYADGMIDAHELVSRARRRYGLDDHSHD